MTMVMIAGHAHIGAADRDRYVAAHQDLVRRARQAKGCLDAAISLDELDPKRINILELWESEKDLDAWREIADAPDTGITVDSDHVMLYVISDVRAPFEDPEGHS